MFMVPIAGDINFLSIVADEYLVTHPVLPRLKMIVGKNAVKENVAIFGDDNRRFGAANDAHN